MLQAALPESKRAEKLAAPTVSAGATREGTGWFDLLDDELLLSIVSQIAYTTTRLNCAISVCKAWRAVLKSPAVFDKVAMTASKYNFRGSVQVTSSNASRLFAWLPDLAAVASLEIEAGDKKDSIGPDVIKKALPQLTQLRELSLSGKKVTAAVLGVAAKQPFAANLEHFSLQESNVAPAELLPLLNQACRLQSLTVQHLDENFVRSLARNWRLKRGGEAVPLLRKLTQPTLERDGKCDWDTFCALPTLFEELEEVTLKFSIFLSGAHPLDMAKFGAPPAQFQRLRVLSIPRLVATYTSAHLSSPDAGRLLRHIFAAAPNVCRLHVGHGSGWLMNSDMAQGRRLNAHPGVDGALADLPTSLTHLHLDTFILEKTDFDMAVGLTSLHSLILTECGPHAEQIARSLIAADNGTRYPNLTLTSCFIRASGFGQHWTPLKSLAELSAARPSKPSFPSARPIPIDDSEDDEPAQHLTPSMVLTSPAPDGTYDAAPTAAANAAPSGGKALAPSSRPQSAMAPTSRPTSAMGASSSNELMEQD